MPHCRHEGLELELEGRLAGPVMLLIPRRPICGVDVEVVVDEREPGNTCGTEISKQLGYFELFWCYYPAERMDFGVASQENR